MNQLNKQIILPIFILSILCNKVIAQQVDLNPMPRPLELTGFVKASLMNDIYEGKRPLDGLTLDYDGSKQESNYWRVYSDRSENQTFSSPNGRPKAMLEFMEDAYITKIQGPWAHLSQKQILEGDYQFVDLGWIRYANLLINDYAVLNERSTTKKALVLLNMDNASEKIAMNEQLEQGGDAFEKYKFYDSPELKTLRGKDQTLRIRFVLKEVKGAKLLSTYDYISDKSESNRKKQVKGWMQNFNLTPWETRICLEPSYGIDYREEYGDLKIPIFGPLSELENFTGLGVTSTDQAIYENAIRKKRMNTRFMRYPIIDQEFSDGQIKKVATVGKIDEVAEEQDENKELVLNTLGKLKKQRENINIVFVIDATASMRKYFRGVAEGLKNIVQINKDKYKMDIKYSVAIYRDYVDGDDLFQCLPATPNDKKVENFLTSVRTYSAGKERSESQYYGIINGLERSQIQANHSNIVVLIGDAGNHRNDKIKLPDVVNTLNKYKASLITFQVMYSSDESYADFNYDAQDYLYQLGEISDRKINMEERLVPIEGKRNSYELRYYDKKDGIEKPYVEAGYGRFIHADDNKEMDVATLKQNLSEALDMYLKYLDNEIAVYENYVEGSTETTESQTGSLAEAQTENIRRNLRKQGMTDEQIERYEQYMGDGFSMSGHTRKSMYNKFLDCYQNVVFLSNNEVDQMLDVFSGISEKASGADAKVQVYNGLLIRTKMALGEQSDDKVKEMTLNEIWEILLNVPFDDNENYGDLGELGLQEIPSSNHPFLPKFILKFQNSVQNFTKSNLAEDRFELYDEVFYWVPLDKIPGNG